MNSFIVTVIRINRYMLECKYLMLKQLVNGKFELIDTCWNVNLIDFNSSSSSILELIDTCWNVNGTWGESAKYLWTELIDTCWNVNSVNAELYILSAGN